MLPKWWKWEAPPDDWDMRDAFSSVVLDEHGGMAACVSENDGRWFFSIEEGEMASGCGGFATEAEAQRAAERVYMAVTAALNAREGE